LEVIDFFWEKGKSLRVHVPPDEKTCEHTVEPTSKNSATEFNFIVYEKKIYNRD
jgi:hypothetical protein